MGEAIGQALPLAIGVASSSWSTSLPSGSSSGHTAASSVACNPSRREPTSWHVETHPENEQPVGIAVLRVENPMFFANAEHIRTAIRAAAEPATKA
jgi:MFS superfamily sulfate permease-like transporter